MSQIDRLAIGGVTVRQTLAFAFFDAVPQFQVVIANWSQISHSVVPRFRGTAVLLVRQL